MVWWFFDVDAICNVFSYINFVHAISGGVGSAFAITVFFPLETVRTRLQVGETKSSSKYSIGLIFEILHREGPSSLYKGWLSLLLSLFMTNFVYFYTFHALKAMLCRSGFANHIYTDLLFGICAGCLSVLVTNPMWVVNTRLKLQDTEYERQRAKELNIPRYYGVIDCLQKVVRFEGVMRLWSGTQSSLLLVSNPAVQFMVYETLKRHLQFLFETEYLGGSCYFICGATAKIAATLVTYPLQVVQTRLRAGYGGKTKQQKGSTTLLDIFRKSGLIGLYKGLEAKLTQTVLTSALMFVTYETISQLIFNIFGLEPS